MRTRTWVKAFVAAVVTAIVLTGETSAARVDLSGTAGLGAIVDSLSSQASLSFTLDINADVYSDGDSYSYVYTISHDATSPLAVVSIDSPHFDASAPWGVIGSGGASLIGATFGGNLSLLMNLPSTSSVTVYVGAAGDPTAAGFFGIDSGFSGFGQTLAPGDPTTTTVTAIPTPAAAPLGLLLLASGWGWKRMTAHRNSVPRMGWR